FVEIDWACLFANKIKRKHIETPQDLRIAFFLSSIPITCFSTSTVSSEKIDPVKWSLLYSNLKELQNKGKWYCKLSALPTDFIVTANSGKQVFLLERLPGFRSTQFASPY